MTHTSRLHLPHLLAGLAALYVAGIALAVSGDLATVGRAIASGSEMNAPLPIIAAQLVGGLIALRAHGRLRIGGALLLLAACSVSLAAAAADGDIARSGLSAAQTTYQCAIAAMTAATWIFALRVLRTRG